MPSGELRIEHVEGDIFDKAQGCVLVHSCNCAGAWGKGIAKAFKDRFPWAYEAYRDYCRSTKSAEDILGTCLLIDPPPDDSDQPYVACLMTKAHWRSSDSDEEILQATQESMQQLVDRFASWDKGDISSGCPSVIKMPKINSGAFGIEWDRTEAKLETLKLPSSFKGSLRLVVFSSGR